MPKWHIRPCATHRSCGEGFRCFYSLQENPCCVSVISHQSALDTHPHGHRYRLAVSWLAAPWFLHHGQEYSDPSQWQQQVQDKCRLGVPGCMWLAPKVSHKMAKFDSIEVSLCSVLSKNLCINFILSIYIQKCICKYCLRQHSMSIVVKFLLINKTFFNFINIEYSPFTNLMYVYCDMANSNDLCTLIVRSFFK